MGTNYSNNSNSVTANNIISNSAKNISKKETLNENQQPST